MVGVDIDPLTSFSGAALQLVFASFFVERALSVVFETKWFIEASVGKNHIRPVIAVLFSLIFVYAGDIKLLDYLGVNIEHPCPHIEKMDPVSNRLTMATNDSPECVGSRHLDTVYWYRMSEFIVNFITAFFIAGGSKASIKIMRDIFNIYSYYENDRLQGAYPDSKVMISRAQKAAEGSSSEQQAVLSSMAKFDARVGITGKNR